MKRLITRSALSAAALSAALAGAGVASGNESTTQNVEDTTITTQIETELLSGEGIWSSDIIRVETVQGMVHLRGYATTERDRRRAGQIAESVAGVKGVENDIRIR